MLTVEEIKMFIDEDAASVKKHFARVGERYFDGDHDIKNYRMFYFNSDGQLVEDTSRANVRIPHPFFKELTEQGTQYTLSGSDGFVYTNLETDLSGKTTELTKANNLIEELKKSAGKDEETQQKITAYETEIADLKKENAELKTENALKFALVAAGAVDVDYLVFKAKEKGEIKLGDDGKIKGEDDLISGLKTQHPTMFEASNGNQQQSGNRKILENNLPGGDKDKTVTKEQFLKMGYNERMKLKEENPELFKQLNVH